MKSKRILSLLFTAVFVFALCAAGAQAEGTGEAPIVKTFENLVLELVADPDTSAIAPVEIAPADAGRVFVDRSVTVNESAMGFDVTLSALMQDYERGNGAPIASALVFYDAPSRYMALQSIALLAGGAPIPAAEAGRDGTHTTYIFAGYDGVTVVHDSANNKLWWTIPADQIPLIASLGANPSVPMRLTYTLAAVDENLRAYTSFSANPAHEWYYDGSYHTEGTSTATFTPASDNPYYYVNGLRKSIGSGDGQIPLEILKSANNTGTSEYSQTNHQKDGPRSDGSNWTDNGVFTVRFGNDGRLSRPLSVTKTAQSPYVAPGGTIDYTIMVKNSSGAADVAATIDDALPAGLTFVPDSGQLLWEYDWQNSETFSGFPHTVAFRYAGDTAVLKFKAAVPPDAALGTVYTNEASIVSYVKGEESANLADPAETGTSVTVAEDFTATFEVYLDNAPVSVELIRIYRGTEEFPFTALDKDAEGPKGIYTAEGMFEGIYTVHLFGENYDWGAWASAKLSPESTAAEFHLYTVAFYDGAPGTGVKYAYGTPQEPQVILAGEKASRPANDPTKRGFSFVRWVDKNGAAFDFNAPVAGTTAVYAQWMELSRTTGERETAFLVSFDSRGGSAVSPVTVTNAARLEPPAQPTRPGYSFTGWFTDPDATTAWDFSQNRVTRDMTLYAGWTAAAPSPAAVPNTGGRGAGIGAWMCVMAAVFLIAGMRRTRRSKK